MINASQAANLLRFLEPVPDGKPGEFYITATALRTQNLMPCDLLEQDFYKGVRQVKEGIYARDVHLVERALFEQFARQREKSGVYR